MSWIEKYVGIPFSDDGFGFAGCHCWGLVRLVLLTEKNIEVPTYGEWSSEQLLLAARKIGGEALLDPWTAVTGPRQAFDVVLMHARQGQSGRVPGHVGILASAEHVIHVERSTSSVWLPLTHRTVAPRVIATFRHRELVPNGS